MILTKFNLNALISMYYKNIYICSPLKNTHSKKFEKLKHCKERYQVIRWRGYQGGMFMTSWPDIGLNMLQLNA